MDTKDIEEHRLKAVMKTVLEELRDEHRIKGEEHTAHHDYIKLAMAREARKEQVRQAVIEKSLTGIIWAGLSGTAILLWKALANVLKS